MSLKYQRKHHVTDLFAIAPTRCSNHKDGKEVALIYLTKELLLVYVCVLCALAESSGKMLVYSLGVRGPQERGSKVVPKGQIFPGSEPLSGCGKGVCFLFQAFREAKHILLNFLALISSDSLV